MKLKALTVLTVILLLHKVRSQHVSDMGDCACVCGLQTGGGVISPSGVTPVCDQALLHYIRRQWHVDEARCLRSQRFDVSIGIFNPRV